MKLYFPRNETAICYKLAGSGDNYDSPISVDSESADNSVSATVISSLNPNASSSATKLYISEPALLLASCRVFRDVILLTPKEHSS